MNSKKYIEQPLLSICIPTWNRAKFLKISLDRIKKQIKDIDRSLLELYVSDNCSTDETEEIVKNYIVDGMPINYNRNQENLGMDGNFLKCIQSATGKYILLLGDDDILLPDSIEYLLAVLKKDDWGLLHIAFGKSREYTGEYNNSNDFLKRVGYEITFMSANIFRRDAVQLVEKPERYFKSFFMQVPFYIKSALSHEKNIIIDKPIWDVGLDAKSNGGYNLYEVFVKSYLGIWHEFVEKKELPMSVYKAIRKDMLMNFLRGYNYNLLLLHRNVITLKEGQQRNGWAVDNAWKILFKHYGTCWYFYYSLLWMFGKGIKGMTKRCLRNIGLYI